MTDLEFKKATKIILKRAMDWQVKLQLTNWDITFQFTRDSVVSEEDSGYAVSALCESDWRYMHAIITFCVPALVSKNVLDLDKIIIHEFMHVFLCETREQEDWLPHEERVASQLTSAIIKVNEGI